MPLNIDLEWFSWADQQADCPANFLSSRIDDMQVKNGRKKACSDNYEDALKNGISSRRKVTLSFSKTDLIL